MKDKKLLNIYKEHPFYQKKCVGLKIDSFLDLPFTTSKDVVDLYNLNRVGDSTIFFTSGTTGEPKAIYYSQYDIESLSDYVRWLCDVEGANGKETVLVLMDQSFWGVGYITGLGHIKAGNIVIPIDNDLPKEKLKEIIDVIKPTVISSLPSVLMEVGDVISGYKFKIIETTGEKLSNIERKHIEEVYGGEVFDAYGLTEVVIGAECREHDGYHFNDKLLKLEIVDPVNRIPVGERVFGELVITTLNSKSTPIIRYLSGDMCKISYGACNCGLRYPKIWILDRLMPTIKLHEGYKIEVSEVGKIIDDIFGHKTFISVNSNKINESKYLLTINLTKSIGGEGHKKIKEAFGSYNYELMHMIRNGKLDIVIKNEKY